MSDNKNKNIQDRGWSEMRSILDNELPEKKKKRRPVIWFFLGGAAIVIIALSALFISPSNMDDSKIVGIEKSIAIENHSLPNIQSNGEKGVEFNEKNNSIIEIERQKQISTGKTQSKNQSLESKKQTDNISSQSIIEKPSKINLTPKPSKSIIKQKNQLLNNDGLSLNIDSENTKFEISDISIIKHVNDENLHKIDKNNDSEKNEALESTTENELFRPLLIPTTILPLFAPLRIDKKEWEADEDKPKIALLNNDRIIAPYLIASAMKRPSLNRLGYGFGAGLNIKRNSLDYYVEAGYYKSNYNLTSGSSDLDTDPASFSPTYIAEVYDSEQASENIASILGSNHKLNISNFSNITTSTSELNLNLGVRKQVFRKLNIDAGVSFAFLLNASNKSFLLDLRSSNKVEEDIFYQVNSSELHNSGAYASYDIVPHVGIEYNVFSNIYFGINYNYGLRNLISNTETDIHRSLSTENEKIYRRNLSAKIRYQF